MGVEAKATARASHPATPTQVLQGIHATNAPGGRPPRQR